MPRFRMMQLVLLALVWLLGVSLPSQAATLTAASCADTAVQSAITSAASGDTVVVPAGTCTWNTTVMINAKALTLRGAGMGQTIITDNGDLGSALIAMNLSATNFVRVTGFSWIQQAAHSGSGIVSFIGAQGTVAFRFDHNRILITFGSARGLYVTAVYGVVDHNILDVTAPVGSVQIITVDGAHQGNDGGITPWTQPLTFGTDQAVYVEDNAVTYGSEDEDSMDAYSGARIVYRHNTVANASIGFHGTDTGALRSLFSVEEYGNTFTNNGPHTRQAIRLRGGTGLMWNNTFGGTTGYFGFTPMLYRATVGTETFSWGYCDGTNWDLGSTTPSDIGSRTAQVANTGVRFLSTAPDTLCASGATCTRFLDGTGSHGYPCRDQPGRTHNQVLAPLYEWNNGAIHIVPFDGGGAPPPGNVGTPMSTWLLENRDFYNFQVGFDGTSGTGQGLFSARPTTCTPLVAYWATDTQTLYQCATPNTWTVYYQPYTYPHPLQLLGGAPPTVAITAPTTGPAFTTASTPLTTLAGTATDADGTVSTVTWVNNRGGSGTATGTTTWTVPSIDLQPGSNVLTVMATDNTGQENTATLTVTYQTAPPQAPSGATMFLPTNLVVAGTLNACVDTGTLNAYACTPSPQLTAYLPLTCYTVLAATGNTGPPTVNFNALGPIPIRKFQGATLVPLASGDIPAGKIVHLCYDGTVMQCQNCGP